MKHEREPLSAKVLRPKGRKLRKLRKALHAPSAARGCPACNVRTVKDCPSGLCTRRKKKVSSAVPLIVVLAVFLALALYLAWSS